MQITTLPKDDVKRGEIYYISREDTTQEANSRQTDRA
jgi:hypothetical protein